MDPKNTDLTPELKQVYDRVMNTQIKTPESLSATPPSSQPSAPAPLPSAPSQTPSTTPSNPTTGQDPFLSSLPPRPIADTKPFVFTGNKVTTHEENQSSRVKSSSSNKISVKIIGLVVVVLIVVWALFWTKLFGLI